jgi:hypothetical protein
VVLGAERLARSFLAAAAILSTWTMGKDPPVPQSLPGLALQRGQVTVIGLVGSFFGIFFTLHHT